MRSVRLALVMTCLLVARDHAAAGEYRLRYSRSISGGCDFRGGWYVNVIGDRLFAGGPWDQNDCGTYGYGLLVYDLVSGELQDELRGTWVVSPLDDRLLLNHVDGIQVADAETLAVERTLVGPNVDTPWLDLQATIGGDALAVGMGDRPETSDEKLVFRLDVESGAVVRRYVIPRPFHPDTAVFAAAGADAVAVGAFTWWYSGSAAGVFVYGADDGALRWARPLPPGGLGFRSGHPVAMTDAHVLVGVPSLSGVLERGQVFVFDIRDGQLLRVLEAPIPVVDDFFGSAVAAADGLVAVGAARIGDYEYPGRVLIFAEDDWRLIDVLSAPSDIALGEAVALTKDVVVAGGNEYDGAIHVFEHDPTVATTTTTLPACAGGCDDGDPCTTDACVAGACVSTPLPGSTVCRLGRLREAVRCAPPRRARRLDVRLRRLVALADAMAAPKTALRAAKRFIARFGAYCARIAHLDERGRLEPSCAAVLSRDCDDGNPVEWGRR